MYEQKLQTDIALIDARLIWFKVRNMGLYRRGKRQAGRAG